MGKRPKQESFADLVAEVIARPAPVPMPDAVDPQGRGLFLVDESITPEHAHELVCSGAALAWDSCGCRGGGNCVVVWFDDAEAAKLAKVGPPILRRTKGRDANLVELRRQDGRAVVFAEMNVRWGDLLD